jgi:hypothetical protein
MAWCCRCAAQSDAISAGQNKNAQGPNKTILYEVKFYPASNSPGVDIYLRK